MLDTLSGTPAEFDNQTSWWRTLIKWNRRRSASPAPEPRPIAEAAAHQCLQRGQSAAAQLLSTGTPAAPGHVHQRLPATPSSRLGPMQPGHCGRNTSLFRSPENNCITDTHTTWWETTCQRINSINSHWNTVRSEVRVGDTRLIHERFIIWHKAAVFLFKLLHQKRKLKRSEAEVCKKKTALNSPEWRTQKPAELLVQKTAESHKHCEITNTRLTETTTTSRLTPNLHSLTN